MSTNLSQIPKDLPVPVDDGAAAHLEGALLPDLALPSTDGASIHLASLGGRWVIYIYPMTGRPGVPLPDGWDGIPGARGCTPQSCSFRDHYAELRLLNTGVFGLSAQTTEYQSEARERLHLPFQLLGDSSLRLKNALRLPTFTTAGMELFKRLTLIVEGGRIRKVFYPVFPPDRNADDVLAWLCEDAQPGAPGAHRKWRVPDASTPGRRPMSKPEFDHAFWERLWTTTLSEHADKVALRPPNQHLVAEVASLSPRRALDAGCGHGAEALWLAAQGWQVTAVDFSKAALAHGRSMAEAAGVGIAERIDWVESDLATWTAKPQHYDLVVCLYVHVSGSVQDMVRHMADGVAPGGTLLLAGHRPIDPNTGAATSAAGQVQVSVEAAVAALDPGAWQLLVAEERPRAIARTGVDAVIRARRRT